MPVDTSMYATLGQQPTAVQSLGQVAGTLGAINQNRLFQQQFKANLAASEAVKAATDPQTGQLDTNKLMAALSQGPAAYNLPAYASQFQQMQAQQLGIAKDKLDLATKHLSNMNNGISSLLAMRDAAGNFNGTSKDVINKMGELVNQGALDVPTATASLQGMPADSKGIEQWLTQHLVQNLDSQAKVQALYGQISPVSTGGTTNFIQTSPLGGVRQVGQIQNTLSPGEAASRIPVVQGGVQGTVPLSSLVTPTGQAPNAQGPAGQPAIPATAPQIGGGQQQAAAGGTPGFVQSQFKPGTTAAADVTAKESAEQGIALQKNADTVPQQKALLGNLESALTQFTSGGGADWKRVAKTFVNSNNPFGNMFDPKSIASQEEFNKQATQLAQSQFQALGGTGTDAKLDSAMHTSPNEALSNLGNQNIINLLKGNADAIAIKNQEWQNFLQNGGSPQDYGKFSTQFNKTYDPRVFQSTYMSPKDRQDMLKGMNKNEVSDFRKAYNLAVMKGWIPDPRQVNGPQQ